MSKTTSDSQDVLPVVNWAPTLTGELLLFNMLSRILLSLPEKEWLDALIEQEIFDETPFAAERPEAHQGRELLVDWSAKHWGGIGEGTLLDLKADYTRLFSGSPTIPVVPWESVYFTDARLVFQERTLDVRKWYRQFGLAVQKPRHEPDDHIGFELSFTAHLAGLALAAHEAGEEGRFSELLEAQKNFLATHLILWGPLWALLMIEHARSDFYRGIGWLALAAFRELAGIFNLKIPDYTFA